MTDLTCEPLLAGLVRSIDWNAALAEHRHWLRTVVLARVREPQAVDEVLQEVALATVKTQPKNIGLDRVGPWLYRVAVIQSIRYQRSRARQRKCLVRYIERCQSNGRPSGPDTIGLLMNRERHRLVEQALRSLPGRDAEILMLKYIERWSYRQLAQHLGISDSAVDGRLQRARARLRQALVVLDVDPEGR